MDSRVSVVIPTRDRLSFLQDAVRSVQRQTLSEWELVVVDDASGDGTWRWLEGLSEARLKTIRIDEHGERSAARNRGLAAASGRYVLFLDDDDKLRSSALKKLCRSLDCRPQAVAAIGTAVLFDDRGRGPRVGHPRFEVQRNVWPDLLAGWGASPSRVLIKADQLRAVGGWNEHLHASEDLELWLRLSRRGPVLLCPTAVVEKRTHPGQWRPTSLRETRERIRSGFVEHLLETERELGDALGEVRDRRRRAEAAYRRGRFRDAFAGYLRMGGPARSILKSPLIGPFVAKRVVQSALGVLFSSLFGTKLSATLRRGMQSISRNVFRRSPTILERPPQRADRVAADTGWNESRGPGPGESGRPGA